MSFSLKLSSQQWLLPESIFGIVVYYGKQGRLNENSLFQVDTPHLDHTC